VPVLFVVLNEFFKIKSIPNNSKKFILNFRAVRTLTDPNLRVGQSAQGWRGLGQKKFAKLTIGPQHLQGRQDPRLKTHGPANVGRCRHVAHREMLALPTVGTFGGFGGGGHDRGKDATESAMGRNPWRFNLLTS